MTLEEYIESEVARHEREVYAGAMPARAKEVLRDMLRKEDEFYAREAVRVDNNTGHDDQ